MHDDDDDGKQREAAASNCSPVLVRGSSGSPEKVEEKRERGKFVEEEEGVCITQRVFLLSSSRNISRRQQTAQRDEETEFSAATELPDFNYHFFS